MGTSMDSSSNPQTRPSQTQKPVQSQNQAVQSQNAGQAAQGQSASAATSKNSSTDNNIAAPRKECECDSAVLDAPES